MVASLGSLLLPLTSSYVVIYLFCLFDLHTLQESLGGHCKTCLIATLSPSVLAVDESFSTLSYAQNANGIQNKPVAHSYYKMNMKGVGVAGGAGGAGGTVQEWEEMECRLQYLEAQVREKK